jgi:hypothetical protein
MVYEWSYPLLVTSKISRAKGIGLGNDRNQVDAGAKTLHDFDVQRLESVTGRADEVQTGVHTKVDLVGSAGLLFLQHVRFVLVVKELNDRLPGVAVVDVVAKAGGINDRQTNWQ